MQEPGALCRNAKIRAEYANGLVYIDRGTVSLGAVDGYPLTGLLEVFEGPIDGLMGHEKRGWKLRKSPELLDFLTTRC